jgi:hypothetical protein
MKKLILATGLCAWAAWLSAQNALPQQNFDLRDREALLGTLFDSKFFTPEGEVLWRPLSFADAVTANFSDDGYLHTQLDTLLYFTTYGISQAVAVFATVHYEKGVVTDCNACGVQLSVAVFDEAQAGRWNLGRFDKHFTTLGNAGQNGTVGLLQFGPNQWCLSLSMDWIGQGVFGTYTSFYNLETLEKVFNYIAHEDNSGALGADAAGAYSFDKSVHFVTHEETESGWWDFEVVTRGTKAGTGENAAALPANSVERYHFNWDSDTFMRVCH